MRERANPKSATVTRVIKGSIAWLWLVMALLFFGLGLNHRVTARQSQGADSKGQAANATIGAGDVHALARLEPASGLIIVGVRPGAGSIRLKSNRKRA